MERERHLQELKNDLIKLKNDLKTILIESGTDISEKTKTLMEEALEKFEDKIAFTKEKTKKTYKDIDEMVHNQPWQTVAAALTIGMLVGLLIGRHRD